MYHIVKDVASLITLSSGAIATGLTFQNTKGQHLYTRLIDMSYIFAGHHEHRQNTQVIFMGCSWLV